MLDLEKIDLPLKHESKRIPGVLRHEIYKTDDITYTEVYDDLSGKLTHAYVTMYDGIKVCNVYEDGSIGLTMSLTWIVNRKTMLYAIDDLTRLDAFLSAINEEYKNSGKPTEGN
jgi:hypothetical protein